MSYFDLYKETILEEAAHPENQGALATADVEHRYGNASCGDMFTVFLELDKSQQSIQKMTWQGIGCAISTAAISQLSQQIIGRSIVDVQGWTHLDLLPWLGLTSISSSRINCITVGLKAVQQGLQASSREKSKV